MSRSSLGFLIAALSFAWLPGGASATGGLLAPSSDGAPLVRTTAADAVLVVDGDAVELHLRLEFDLSAPRQLAWVIPTATAPVVGVGSERLFQNLEVATVPTWATRVVERQCVASDDVVLSVPPIHPSDGNPPMPVASGMLGAYSTEIVVDAAASQVVAILDGHGIETPPLAAAILEDYAQLGRSFVVLTFVAPAGHSIVHPIVLRYTDAQPQLPLRLAAINASQDMNLRVFVLGDERWVPGDFQHVTLNPLAIDWLQLGANYQEVLIDAIDTPEAGGRAFVTEALLPASEVATEGLFDSRWNAEAFESLESDEVADELVRQGLFVCQSGLSGCDAVHPLAQSLAADFLLPDGVSLGDFRNCPSCYEGTVFWQPAAFVAAFRERIVEPAEGAQRAMAGASTVSRLRTRASPDELTSDPRFVGRKGDDSIASKLLADATLRCSGDLVLDFPDSRELLVPRGGPWPHFDDAMPLVERVEQMTSAGPTLVLASNTEEIDRVLAEHNAQHGWPLATSCRAGGQRAPGSQWLWLVLLLGLRRARRSGRLVTVVAAGALLGSGCANKAQSSAATAPLPTTADEINAELARNEQALRDAGVSVPQAPSGATVGPDTTGATMPSREEAPRPVVVAEDEDLASEEEGAPTDDAPELSTERVSMGAPEAHESRSKRSDRRGGNRRSVRDNRKAESTRCARICDLAEATCDLAEHVCRLAQDHPRDARYVDACARAELQCFAAQDACMACE